MSRHKKIVDVSKYSGTSFLNNTNHDDRSITHNLMRYVASLNAALVVARWKEYNYALSEHQLNQLELTRDDVPANLLRALSEHQD